MTDLSDINHNTETDRPVEALPPRWYLMRYVDDEQKVLASRNGSRLEQIFKVDGDEHPEYADRTVYNNLNLWHNKPQTVAIAKGDLTKQAEAMGHFGPVRETEMFKGKKIACLLGIERSDRGRDRNVIKDYAPPTKFASQQGIGSEGAQGSAQQGEGPAPQRGMTKEELDDLF